MRRSSGALVTTGETEWFHDPWDVHLNAAGPDLRSAHGNRAGLSCLLSHLSWLPRILSLDLHRQFLDPPADARPMMRWWWFGPAVTKPELKKELETMRGAGIGGVEIQPVYPLMLDDESKGIKNLHYLSPEFLDDVTLRQRDRAIAGPARRYYAGQRLALWRAEDDARPGRGTAQSCLRSDRRYNGDPAAARPRETA